MAYYTGVVLLPLALLLVVKNNVIDHFAGGLNPRLKCGLSIDYGSIYCQ